MIARCSSCRSEQVFERQREESSLRMNVVELDTPSVGLAVAACGHLGCSSHRHDGVVSLASCELSKPVTVERIAGSVEPRHKGVGELTGGIAEKAKTKVARKVQSRDDPFSYVRRIFIPSLHASHISPLLR